MGSLRILKTSGTSMSPFLLPEDTLHIRRVRPKEIRFGDLLLFAERTPLGTRVKVHRVFWRHWSPRGPVFWTKGDNLLWPDDPVPPYAVLGRVAIRERGGEMLPIETGSGRWRSLLSGFWGSALSLLNASREKYRSRLADIRAKKELYVSQALSYPARLLPHGPKSWRIMKDRFPRGGRCLPKNDGPSVELRGLLDKDLELGGEILLTGDVQVGEGCTLRLRAGTTVRARPQSFKLSIIRRIDGRHVEFCDPAGAQIVVRGSLVAEGSPEAPVVFDFGSGFEGLIAVGEGKIEARNARIEGARTRALAVLDEGKAKFESGRFSGGRRTVVGSGAVALEFQECRFEQDGSADRIIELHGAANANVKAGRFSGGRVAIEAKGSIALDLRDCSFEQDAAAERAISLIGRGRATVVTARFSGAKIGIATAGPLSLELKDCLFENELEGAIAAGDGSRIEATGLRMKQTGTALRLEGSSNATIESWAIEGCGTGALLPETASLSIQGLDCSATESPLVARGASNLRLQRAAVKGGRIALLASNQARVTLEDCRFDGQLQASLSGEGTCVLTAKRLSITHSADALRLEASASATIEDCSFLECRNGALLRAKASVVLRALVCAVSESHIVVKDAAQARIERGELTGGRAGVLAAEQALAELEDCKLQSQKETAIVADGASRIRGRGMRAADSGEALRLTGNSAAEFDSLELGDCSGTLISVYDGAKISCGNVRSGKSSTGVLLAGSSNAEFKDIDLQACSGASIEASGTARFSCRNVRAIKSDAGLRLAGGAVAHLSSVEVKDCSGALVAVLDAARVSCRSVHAEKTSEGLQLSGSVVAEFQSLEIQECAGTSISASGTSRMTCGNARLEKSVAGIRLSGSASADFDELIMRDCASGALLDQQSRLAAGSLACSGSEVPLSLEDRAGATARRGEILGGRVGAHAGDQTSLELSRFRIERQSEVCLAALHNSRVRLESCSFNRASIGMRASEDSALELHFCRFQGHAEAALVALERAQLVGDRFDARDCAAGIRLDGSAKCKLRHVRFESCESAALVAGESSLSLADASAHRGKLAFQAEGRATLEISRCRLSEQTDTCFAGLHDARLSIEDAQLEVQDVALRVEGSVRARLAGASAIGGRLAVDSSGESRITLRGCRFIGQSEGAVCARDNASMRADGLRILQVPTALRLQDKSKAVIASSRIERCDAGARLSEQALLFAFRNDFLCADAALLLDDRAIATMVLGRLSGAKSGLAFLKSNVRFTAIGLRWRESSNGLIAEDGASIRLFANTMEALGRGAVLRSGSKMIFVGGRGDAYGDCFLELSGSQAALWVMRQNVSGRDGIRCEASVLRVHAIRLSASSAALSVHAGAVSLSFSVLQAPRAIELDDAATLHCRRSRLGSTDIALSIRSGRGELTSTGLEGAVGIRLESGELRSRYTGAARCSIGAIFLGSGQDRVILFRKEPCYISRLDIAEDRIALKSAMPPHHGDRLLEIATILRHLPRGRDLLRLPYRACLWAAKRRFRGRAKLWVRRSWASDQAEPGLSDLDLLLELPSTQPASIEALGRDWKALRRRFPFLGEPIIANRGELEAYARHGDFRSRQASGEWKPLTPDDRLWPVPENGSPLKLSIDRWTEGFSAYLRLVATNSDLPMLKHRELYEHRFNRSWRKTWTIGKGAEGEPPPMRKDPFEACAQALQWMDEAASEILQAVDTKWPGLWSSTEFRAEHELAVPPQERMIVEGVSAVIEQPRHLSYLVLEREFAPEKWSRTFKASLYVRARFEFLRCLALPVTEPMLSLLLCGPYQDWPYQTAAAASWPRFRIPGASGTLTLREWKRAEGDAQGLERELLLECLANAELHRGARVLGLVGEEDPGVPPDVRIAALKEGLG